MLPLSQEQGQEEVEQEQEESPPNISAVTEKKILGVEKKFKVQRFVFGKNSFRLIRN